MELTVLVIENDKKTSEFISNLLCLEGYKVLIALTGKSGVKLCNQLMPDLILCDVMVPEIDGYGVLHILGKNPTTAKIPFIFLSAKASLDDFRKGMNLGADDYIIKPFNSTDLLSAIEIRLRKYKLIKNDFDENNESQDWHKKDKQPKELRNLCQNGLKKLYNKKDYLFTIGESQHYLYFIITGGVKVSSTNESGKEMILHLVGNGQFIGYKSLMNGSVYTEDAIALAPTEVKLIKAQDFQKLIYCNREIAKWFINSLSYDLIQTEKRLTNLAYQSVRQRVAEALVQIHDHQNLVSKGNILNTLSRKNLAAIVGTALESLNRTILDFKKEGIVEITPLGIHILKMDKLEQIFRLKPIDSFLKKN